jgi:hypothetical protein
MVQETSLNTAGKEKLVDDDAATTVAGSSDTSCRSASSSVASSTCDEACALGECFVCMEDCADAPLSPCKCIGRHIHERCLLELVRKSGKGHCSVCRSPYTDLKMEVRTSSRPSLALLMVTCFIICSVLMLALTVLLFTYAPFGTARHRHIYIMCGAAIMSVGTQSLCAAWFTIRAARRDLGTTWMACRHSRVYASLRRSPSISIELVPPAEVV